MIRNGGISVSISFRYETNHELAHAMLFKQEKKELTTSEPRSIM